MSTFWFHKFLQIFT